MKTPLQLLMEQNGIKNGQKFKIKGNEKIFNGNYLYENNEIFYINPHNANKDYVVEGVFANLFLGNYLIIKKPFEPKKHDIFHYVTINGEINMTIYIGTTGDFLLIKMGNCFKTRDEALINRAAMLAKFNEA